MLSSQKTTTDIGTVVRVQTSINAFDGTVYQIRLDNGHWHFIPKYRLDKKPKIGETAEVTRDLFDSIIGVKLNGMDCYKPKYFC